MERAKVMTEADVEGHKKLIDTMTQEEMARLWRFAPVGHPYFDASLPLWEHFERRFKALGGMTPVISKHIGLEETVSGDETVRA